MFITDKSNRVNNTYRAFEKKSPKSAAVNPVQCKLSVGSPNDPYEKEADAMADKVMRMPENDFVQQKCADCEKDGLHRKRLPENITPFIQTKSEGDATVSDSVADAIQASKGSGSILNGNTQSFMNSRFGRDFSNVKIHTGNTAFQINRNLNAKAFTTGNDIYFNEGQYQPNSTTGKQLLAHELTHVVQQQNMPAVIQKQGNASEPRGGLSIHFPVVDEFLTHVSDVHSALAGRSLLRPEVELARTIFGNSIDYPRVKLILGDLASGTTAGNNIRLPVDFNITNHEHKQLLIHEMTHVWQFQHMGAGYITTSLLQQMHASVTRHNRNFAYDYQVSTGNSFFEFAPEQQAFIVENYFAMLQDQQLIASSVGTSRTYKSNHLASNGFNAVITAQQRNAEINTELPLHGPLINQMSATPFLSAASLMLVRQRDVLVLPPQDVSSPASRDQPFLPTSNLLEIRFR